MEVDMDGGDVVMEDHQAEKPPKPKPTLPIEIVLHIIEDCDYDKPTFNSLSCVSVAWRAPCQKRLFSCIIIDNKQARSVKWYLHFFYHKPGLARYVENLEINNGEVLIREVLRLCSRLPSLRMLSISSACLVPSPAGAPDHGYIQCFSLDTLRLFTVTFPRSLYPFFEFIKAFTSIDEVDIRSIRPLYLSEHTSQVVPLSPLAFQTRVKRSCFVHLLRVIFVVGERAPYLFDFIDTESLTSLHIPMNSCIIGYVQAWLPKLQFLKHLTIEGNQFRSNRISMQFRSRIPLETLGFEMNFSSSTFIGRDSTPLEQNASTFRAWFTLSVDALRSWSQLPPILGPHSQEDTLLGVHFDVNLKNEKFHDDDTLTPMLATLPWHTLEEILERLTTLRSFTINVRVARNDAQSEAFMRTSPSLNPVYEEEWKDIIDLKPFNQIRTAVEALGILHSSEVEITPLLDVSSKIFQISLRFFCRDRPLPLGP